MFQQQSVCPYCSSWFWIREKYEQGRSGSDMLTTQKVSHPPVKPKYGGFAPARPVLIIAMTQWLVNVKDEHGGTR